jgi:branched-chain amino acid transport system permease protein
MNIPAKDTGTEPPAKNAGIGTLAKTARTSAWSNLGIWLLLGVILVVGLWPVIGKNAALREAIFTIMLSMALASSLNIILGYTGYVSFGHIVFFGLGGYVGLYLLSAQGLSLWISILAGGAAAGLLAFLLGKAILRLRGAYFALATIGVNEAVRSFISNFKPFGGPIGMSLNFGIYKEYGGATEALWLAYYILLGLTILAILLSQVVKTSKFGLGLVAIREDEDAAEVMGVVAPNAKTWAYVLSAIIPGMIGVLFYFKNGNVEPQDAFRLQFSIELLVMVMLGGFGTVSGPILGAAGYQRLRGYLLTSPIFKDIQLVIAGVMLLIIILFIPGGAVGWLRSRFPILRRVLP